MALEDLVMGRFLLDREGQPAPETVADHGRWSMKRRVKLPKLARADVVERLAGAGITSPATLAALAVMRQDPEPLAQQLGITPSQAVNLMHHGLDWLPDEQREALIAEAAKDNATGLVELDSPEYREMFRDERLGAIPRIDPAKLTPAPWAPTALAPRAIDHRPLLGPARNQNPRGTCYAFGAVAVREFHENARAGGAERIDLSEEYVVWHGKKGALFTAGGGDGIATLKTLATAGACREQDWPYVNENWAYNDAHVPAPSDVLAKASFYRGGPVVWLTAQDVPAVKGALAKGKVVVFHGAARGVLTATGECRFPGPDEEFPINHAMAVVGYVDSDDVPDTWGGGYFIVRNSHGDRAGINNVMGPDYGGHVRMPYAYYENHTSAAGTFGDDELTGSNTKQWLAEYYDNRDLEGTPWLTRTVDQIAFEWGYEGPMSDFVESVLGVDVQTTEDHFSARWSTMRYFDAGWYWFETVADDGIRVYVDDRLVINEWHPQPATQAECDHYVPAGMHVLRVEYFERTGHATAKFSYGPRNWWGYVYDNADASGPPDHTLEVTEPAYEWRHVPPVDAVDDRFSVKVEGYVDFPADEDGLVFHALATGGISIAVDDVVVFDALSQSAGPYQSPPVAVAAGLHKISVVFSSRATRPAAGDGRIFTSNFRVGWFSTGWDVSVYRDERRKLLHQRPKADRKPDHEYQIHHGLGLSGEPIASLRLDDMVLPAADFDAELGLTGETTWVSLLAHRRVVSDGGRHRFRIQASNGFRFVVDGRCLLDNFHGLAPDTYDVEVELAPGVHDLAVEYDRTAWGAHLVLDDVSDKMWTATWYANRSLSGTPAGVSNVDKIDFDWGLGSPTDGVGPDNFSVEFRTDVHLRRGRYRFVVRSDDGVRVYVDNRLVIDSWFDRGSSPDVVEIDLPGGRTPIRLEYYERGGYASLYFDYDAVGYLGAFYRGRELGRNANNVNAEPPVLYRYEPFLDFDWGPAPADTRLGRDNFSARWTGLINLPVGRYEIRTTTDDGVRLLVDGMVLIDRWKTQKATERSRTIDLVGRDHEVTLEYYEHGGLAECRLEFDRIL